MNNKLMSNRFANLLIALTATLMLACTPSSKLLNQSSIDKSIPKNVGIQGFSAVSYFEENKAQRGSSQYSYEYKNRIYYFTSDAQIETFKQNPEKHLPKYGEYCPYSLALGRRVGIDPTNFKIVNGELLLFHSAVELSTVDVVSQKEVFDKAEKRYNLLKF